MVSRLAADSTGASERIRAANLAAADPTLSEVVVDPRLMIANRGGRNPKKLSGIIGTSFPVVMAVQELLLFPG